MDFIIGCNYWASNAGTEMWKEWDETAVRKDLKVLSENGIKYLRVFPNWRDFQPVIPIYGGGYNIKEFRLEGDVKPQNEYYLDEVMLSRFSLFCDMCEEYDIKLIVGFLAGWMSGRLFVPAALYAKNLFSDSVAVLFEQRLIKGMVTLFKNKKAIYAWDIGNECHALGEIKDEYTTINWTMTMANAIKASDNSRPVISSMNRPAIDKEKNFWTIKGEAESCDILVSHPYPFWSEYGYKDYTLSFRTLIHGVCEAKYFSDLSGKPCLIEEIGTMGPMVCSENSAADFMRVNAYAAWVNSLSGIMWWCANDQTNLNTDPYTDNMCEAELGMMDIFRNPKPVLMETKRIENNLSSLDFKLPPAKIDAVCILTKTQDQWAAAYMTYGLALQAGLNIKFAYAFDDIPECDVYIMPSVSGANIMLKENFDELKKRVADGATLYISNNDGIVREFKELCGVEVIDSGVFNDKLSVKFEDVELPFERRVRYNIETVGAEVLAKDSMEMPAITRNNYGCGEVYYVNFPLETMLLEKNNVFDEDYYRVYEKIFSSKIKTHIVKENNKYVGITAHCDKNGDTYCVAINYSDKEQGLVLSENVKIRELYGKTNALEPFGMCVFKVL